MNLTCNKNNFWDQNQNVNNLWRIVTNNLNEFDSSDIHTLKFRCGKFLLLDLLKKKKNPDIPHLPGNKREILIIVATLKYWSTYILVELQMYCCMPPSNYILIELHVPNDD